MTARRWVLAALASAAAGCTIDPFPTRMTVTDASACCPGVGCVDLLANIEHCGRCGQRCGDAPNVNAGLTRCVSGVCAVAQACTAGWADCDGDPSNGCEANLRDPAHCGRCGTVCRDPSPVCRAFVAVPVTDAGAGAVDAGDASLGTPVDDVPAGDASIALVFRCVDNCPVGQVRCGDPPACVDVQTDPRACGACGTPCLARANTSAACTAGRCVQTCLPGFSDCDHDLAAATSNGCEANLGASPTNCGACGTTCTATLNRQPICTSGMCAPGDCAAGYADCDGIAATGCETALTTSNLHCGRCGNNCAFSNATSMCVAGACSFMACNQGFGNCDSDPANGCEASLRDTVANCGSCGMACPARPNSTPTCVAGMCALSCAAGFGDCDLRAVNGCETNLNEDNLNCTACGRVCSACGGGMCTP